MSVSERSPFILTTFGNGRRHEVTQIATQRERAHVPLAQVLAEHPDIVHATVYQMEAPDHVEAPLGDVNRIAAAKNLVGWQEIAADYPEFEGVGLSADAMPAIMNIADRKHLPSMKKPKDLQEVQQNFQLLADNAHNGRSEYSIQAATTMGTIRQGQMEHQQNRGLESRFGLNAEAVQAIADDMTEYITTFREINGTSFPLTKVAGGFCAEVLIAMGAIDTIDGIDLNDPAVPITDKYDAIYGALYTAITTVSPQTLHHLTQLEGYPQPTSEAALMERVSHLKYLEDLTLRVMAHRQNREQRPTNFPESTHAVLPSSGPSEQPTVIWR